MEKALKAKKGKYYEGLVQVRRCGGKTMSEDATTSLLRRSGEIITRQTVCIADLTEENKRLRQLETLVKRCIAEQRNGFDILASDWWDQVREHMEGKTDE